MNDAHEWDFGFQTDPGQKRKGEPNQDAVLVVQAAGDKAPILILADGMGGHLGGETASRIVVETVHQAYSQARTPADYGALLANCLVEAHQALRLYASQHGELENMGSTAVLVALDGENMFVANVGDSRAYLLRGRAMKQVSYDHSVVADKVRAGLITHLEALRNPQRNRLTQALSARRVEIKPFVAQIRLRPDDTVLLCTDGLWGVVADAVVQAVALELAPQQAAEKLVALANISQAPDNVSVVIARRKTARPQSMTDDDDETTNQSSADRSM
jgi:serine/threonine protein phosphatase PrpC